MQRFSRFDPLLVFEELGTHSKVGETPKCSELECEVFLLEEIRVRDLQENVPIHL
jgi:hypothetical protein